MLEGSCIRDLANRVDRQPDRQERADLPRCRSSRAPTGSCSATIPRSASGGEMSKPPAYTRDRSTKHPRIDGVKTKPLRAHPRRARLADGDPARRRRRSCSRSSARSTCRRPIPGVVKAWHYHQQQVDNFACVAGMVKLVLVDTRAGLADQRARSTSSSSARRTRRWCRCRTSSITAGSASAPRCRWSSTCRPSRITTPSRTSSGSTPHDTLPYDWTRKDG